jgi:hypothetical protein
VESAFQIKIVRENLALAISLWAAASKGVITAAFVPAKTEFPAENGEIVKVSSPLELRDNRELIRCTSNQIRGAFAFSALQTHRALEAVCSGSPLEEMDPDLRAARCIFYLLNHALNRDLMSPVWYGTVEYQRRFDVGPAYFSLDLPALEGKAVTWQDFGGLDRYLALLEYCSVRAAEAPPAWQRRVTPAQSAAPAAPADPISPASPTGETSGEVDYPAAALPDNDFVTVPPPAATTPSTPSTTAAMDSLIPLSAGDPAADTVTAFIAAQCVTGSEAMSLAKDLYDAYSSWCQEAGRAPLAQRSFGIALTSRGFERRRRGRGKHWWIGVGLLASTLAQ